MAGSEIIGRLTDCAQQNPMATAFAVGIFIVGGVLTILSVKAAGSGGWAKASYFLLWGLVCALIVRAAVLSVL